MHTTKQDIQRLKEDFRIEAVAVMDSEKLLQKELADELGVNQSTICRWISYQGDIDFPASLIPALHEKFPALGFTLLRWQAERMGYAITKRPDRKNLNGNVLDEMIDMNSYLARLLDDIRDGKVRLREAKKMLSMMSELIQKANMEIEEMPEER